MLPDFDEAYFTNNFGLDRREVQSLIENGYKKEDGFYRIQQENPITLSIMRALDSSLENSSLFSVEEVTKELYPQLISHLDGMVITHEDGMKTTLFISPDGDLSATFRPGNKPWTRVLISSRKEKGERRKYEKC